MPDLNSRPPGPRGDDLLASKMDWNSKKKEGNIMEEGPRSSQPSRLKAPDVRINPKKGVPADASRLPGTTDQ